MELFQVIYKGDGKRIRSSPKTYLDNGSIVGNGSLWETHTHVMQYPQLGGSKKHWCPIKRFKRFLGIPDSKTL